MDLVKLQAVFRLNELTLLYFSTPSCNVCKVLRPKVEELLTDTPPWHFEYINTEESMEVAGQYTVFAVPTLLLMVEGREVARFSRHFSIQELEAPIRRYAKLINNS